MKVLICPECKNGNQFNFVPQLAPNDHLFTCGECGLCDVDTSELDDNPDNWDQIEEIERGFAPVENLDNCAIKPLDKVSTYQRKAHITERLSQTLCKEPVIEVAHQTLIRDTFGKLLSQNKSFKKSHQSGKICKREVQQILRSLNKTENTKKFTTKYLVSKNLFFELTFSRKNGNQFVLFF